jgi:hypothetical protein
MRCLFPTKLRFIIKAFDNEPIPYLDCEMEVEGNAYKIKSKAQGLIEPEIPRNAEKGRLRIPSLGLEVPLQIAYLDPLNTESGSKSRLMKWGILREGMTCCGCGMLLKNSSRITT